MTGQCQSCRDQLVAHIQGDLGPLDTRWMAGHLGRCHGCQALHGELHAGLQAARDWQPAPVGLERLQARLDPYIDVAVQKRARGVRAWGLTVATAAVVSLLGVAGMWLVRGDPMAPAPVAKVVVQPAPDFRVDGVDPNTVVRNEVSPYVRLIAPAQWSGAIERRGKRVDVDMDRGYAAISFVGGQGRRLTVRTPAGTVEVVGTRFFVELAERDVTVVGVVDGKVAVRTRGGRHIVRAGQTLAFDASGQGAVPEGLEAPWVMEDKFLTFPHRAPVAARPSRERQPRLRQQTEPIAVQGETVMDRLARAEALARAGAVRDALAIYQACANDSSPAYAPYRDLSRYEAARLLGFALGERRQAQRMLQHLSLNAQGEVRLQAILGLCELQLDQQPCGARRCLETLTQGDAEQSVRQEATRLLGTWGLRSRACP